MWMGIWMAWCSFRNSLIQVLPSNWSEKLRQPLFGNRHIRNLIGEMLGTHDTAHLNLWGNRGFSTIADLWDPQTAAWRLAAEIRHSLRSINVENNWNTITTAVPWRMEQDIRLREGDWVANLEELGEPSLQHIFHICSLTDQ
jgi:hypothetical protein